MVWHRGADGIDQLGEEEGPTAPEHVEDGGVQGTRRRPGQIRRHGQGERRGLGEVQGDPCVAAADLAVGGPQDVTGRHGVIQHDGGVFRDASGKDQSLQRGGRQLCSSELLDRAEQAVHLAPGPPPVRAVSGFDAVPRRQESTQRLGRDGLHLRAQRGQRTSP